MNRLAVSALASIVVTCAAFAEPPPWAGRGAGAGQGPGVQRRERSGSCLLATRPADAANAPAAGGFGRRGGAACCRAGCQGCGMQRGRGAGRAATTMPADSVPAGSGRGMRAGRRGMGATRPAGQGLGGGMSQAEHEPIWRLLDDHASIARKVKEIDGGVETRTTTSKPELVEQLRTHVSQMTARLESGRPVRMWDPVFRGLFEHADEVVIRSQEIDGGLLVTETSDNPEVTRLIRAHAAKVSEFAERGHAAARPPWAGQGHGRWAQ